MKAKILRAQGSYDVGQVVGKTQKTVLKKFYKDAFYTELLPLPFLLLASSPTQSFYIPCFHPGSDFGMSFLFAGHFVLILQ